MATFDSKQNILHKPDTTNIDIYEYTYDNMERLLTATVRHDGASAVTLCQNTYNSLGQLATHSLGSSSQGTISYTYNVRGWPHRQPCIFLSLHPQLSTLNPTLSTLNSHPSTLIPHPSTLNPKPYMLSPFPSSPISPYLCPHAHPRKRSLNRAALEEVLKHESLDRAVCGAQSASTTKCSRPNGTISCSR